MIKNVTCVLKRDYSHLGIMIQKIFTAVLMKF